MNIGEQISRVRTINKLQNEDAKISDRVIYTQMLNIRDRFIKNEDDKKALSKMIYLFRPLHYVELIEVDTIEACGIDSECTVMRTKDRLPDIVQGASGPVIKAITSIDGTITVNPTTRVSAIRKMNLNEWKYNNDLYYYIEDDYAYFPNLDWDAVRVFAFWEDPYLIESMNDCDSESSCVPMKEREFFCPSHLNDPIMDKVIQEIAGIYSRLREDEFINKNSNT